MEKLNKKFKERWLKALKSGKYPKGRGKLKSKTDGNEEPYEDGKFHYCCLGVAGELCGVKGISSKYLESEYLEFDFNKNMRGRNKVPLILQGDYGIAAELAVLNDENDTFEPVIEYIEKNL